MFWDAHCHLQASSLHAHEGAIMEELRRQKVVGAVVNGTHQGDWRLVAEFCARYPHCQPAFGLHPWSAAQRTETWSEELAHWLDHTPRASLGECGLDRWMKDHDLADQLAALRVQWRMAATRELPVTIHCLAAWGALLEFLRDEPSLRTGFLIHAFSGSAEVARELAKLGGYFSFSPYFLHARKGEARRIFSEVVPADRLLVETDAPDMAPPLGKRRWRLDPGDINHPANLLVAYEELAALRNWSMSELQDRVAESFARLFGSRRGAARHH